MINTGAETLKLATVFIPAYTAERINAAREKLESASHRLAEAMYRSTAGAQTQGGPQGDAGAQQQQKPKENVVDAEFVDVDDKEKK